ncbi:MAG: DDE-type integrase/transposase/recombinase [bacterium]|nr:DDE-type integrase/transposase/recombinase [bacterium]
MNRLSLDRQSQIVKVLCEGNSIRSTARITDTSINTVVKLLRDVGIACLEYQDKVMRDLPCERIQCDEIWSFCYAKAKSVPKEHQGEFGYGDVWTWTAICADTKIVPSFLVGGRTYEYARAFMADLASRLSKRVQLTIDGHKAYIEAVDRAFRGDIDYAILIKLYGADIEKDRKYSADACIGTRKEKMNGKPDPKHVSTSYVERQNLTMRMSMRRFTRLTNGFSKKVENHEYAIALYFMHYNFARTHKSLRNPYDRTPAMAAGISDHIWTIEEIVSLVSK